MSAARSISKAASSLVRIAADTKLVGLIGHPVGHSKSPAMHNAAFRALGLPWAYLAFPVPPGRVGDAVRAVPALGLEGLNVTIPHKEAVLPHLDRLSPRARACGAVNTIVHRRGRLSGDNTDVLGLERDWSELGVPKRVSDAIVLGAGGSARAAIVALAGRSRRVLIAARRPERARALAKQLRPSLRRTKLEAIDLAELRPDADRAESRLAEAGLIVNATSAGMKGEPFFPFAYDAAPRDCFFYDLIYTQRRTPFLVPAARRRCPVATGLGMLLHQGAAAFEIWTGVEPPLDVMRRALTRKS